MTDKERFEAYVNGTITAEELAAFEQYLMQDAGARARLRQVLNLDARLYDLVESRSEGWAPARPAPRRLVTWLALAASVAFAAGLGTWRLLARPTVAVRTEATAEGFAVVRRLVNAETEHHVGDAIGKETFRLARGMAQIDFFSGATVVLEGPASLDLRSASEAVLTGGKLRAHVPPAARGFKVRSASTEIVDLGTEFGLDATSAETKVSVFDGLVKLSSNGNGEPAHEVKAGRSWIVGQDGKGHEAPLGAPDFLDPIALGRQYEQARRRQLDDWKIWNERFVRDPRLVAYYDMSGADTRVGDSKGAFDGTIVAAQRVPGRWGDLDAAGALEFGRPGSGVRVHIPGEWRAFTFVCWVRIDALDRWYNALFMGDGYENGEPHWQIREDGKLMLSVMVDETRRPPRPNPLDRGYHRVYFSPPMWDPSMSGRWLHVVSVFDPAGRRVSHFVNGVEIHREAIRDEYFVDKLHIGSATIGNWGEPFQNTPRFAIRNLNGRIDELAILEAAWTADEVGSHYRRTQGSH